MTPARAKKRVVSDTEKFDRLRAAISDLAHRLYGIALDANTVHYINELLGWDKPKKKGDRP